MKNYYDELEISKTASKEVIEKAYKVLAKKYHPDVTQESDKQKAEEKFKIISEAYEILSDDEKRKKYDLELEQSNPTISYEDYMNVVRQRDSLNNSLNNLKNQVQQNNRTNYQQNYNQTNSNYSNHTNYNTNQNHATTNTNYKSKKPKYYNVVTGKPVSAITYYIYRIKKFFSNIGLFLLAILALILMLNALLPNNILESILK